MSDLNISSFIWSIADDVLRDVYVRGKYRDVILPMTVIRRLDAVLEPTKDAVLRMKEQLDAAGITNQDRALRQASGEAFYNTSPFRLRDLTSRRRHQQLRADFESYLDGFSPNVQEVLEKFKFRNQIPTLVEADALGFLLEKFLDSSINLSPRPVLNDDGSVGLEGLDNHRMGTVFEELIRRFNEENNEEAGEHFTPRDVVQLMARLVFLPVADEVKSGTYLVYGGACGTGGMLTVAEETLWELAGEHGKEASVHLYGQEVNPETYAISKADLILKGEGVEADNMRYGSTLSADAFPAREFDFMLSNPPYGKSWKSDLERMGGKSGIKDPRFVVEHAGNPEYSLITRSSDGQMMFLANMLSKMKRDTPMGSRIAEVHNGSSLFTGAAGQGESNIRRWIIENDWLEAIVALPLNMFYNTGIATYVWVLSNRKPAHRRGKVQLIDATQWSRPLRKNLGNKNCELSDEDIRRICDVFRAFEETEQSKKFPNEAFGYWKVTVERPLRLEGVDPERVYTAREIRELKDEGVRSETARPVIKKLHKLDVEADPLRGLFDTTIKGKPRVVEYEPDPELRDTEHIPLPEDGGLDAFLRREVLPYALDAWYVPDSVKVGYEISFTRHFYRPRPLRPLEEIRADIIELERETEGLLVEIVGSGTKT
ncbi:MAG: class I SAM-dependent DNA methyltransferase [Deltaproteobacteria bacterium]|nr:class I SAM-dependent DNA methyltransferase [Deltaproteobacteria bacterium]